ncbi:hypothetical protein ACFWHX_38690, partial [Streptomyces hirsutus]
AAPPAPRRACLVTPPPPPPRTLTVKLRLALTSDAVAGEVVATAAIVQRYEDDGDWVGQSDEYRFRITTGPGTGPATDPDAEAADPHATTPAPRDNLSPSPLPLLEELARTGSRTGTGGGTFAAGLTAAAVALVAGGLALLRAARRRR